MSNPNDSIEAATRAAAWEATGAAIWNATYVATSAATEAAIWDTIYATTWNNLERCCVENNKRYHRAKG